MKHEEYKELLAADALNALDAVERQALDAHLATCAECHREAETWREAAASLAFAAAPVAPPVSLRVKLLEAVRMQSNLVREETTQAEQNGERSVSQTSSNVVSLEAQREKRRGVIVSKPLLLFGSIAASIAVATLAITLAMVWSENRELQAQLADTAGRLRRSEQDLATLRADRELLAAPEALAVALAGTESATSARARLTYDQRTGRALLVASNLPPAPAGKAYQLWFIAGGKPLPGGLFNPNAGGRAELYDTVPPAGRNASVFAVTLEPQGGVAAPTGSMYLKGAVS